MDIDIMAWIANQGFAIAVAGFLLLRIEGKLGTMNDSLIRLIERLDAK